MPEIDRRDFLKLVGASAGAAAAVGCSDKVTKLIPYVVQPEEINPGVPVYYASTCRECAVGCGIHVKTRESRPIKVEGNPDHPVNKGRLCTRAQASVNRTYLPDRYPGPMRRNAAGKLERVSWDDAIATVAEALRKAPAKAHVLGGHPGDTASGLVDRFVEAAGLGGRTVYEAFSCETLRAGTKAAFDVESEPIFDISGADLVVDFGSEMLESGPSPVEHGRQWSDARDPRKHKHGGQRLVYVGPRLSVTASSADEWLPARPGSEGILALALARVAIEAGAGRDEHRALLGGLLASADAASAARKTDVPAETIQRLGRALAKAKSAVGLPPGVGLSSRRSVAATAAVLVLNDVLGATGRAMIVPPAPETPPATASYRDVLALVKDMQDGKVGVLLIHDANPVYSLPKAAGFTEALSKVELVVSFADAPDETSARAHLVLPNHAPLEQWGDLRPRPGIRSLIQPSFQPLHDTRFLVDSLLAIARKMGPDIGGKLPSGSFHDALTDAWADVDFRKALEAGGVFAQAPRQPVSLAAGVSRLEVAEPKFTGDGDTILFAFPHSFMGDGRGAALPVLQEIPDPITSVAWDSWAEVSLGTAKRLGVEVGDIIAIETSAGRVEVPVYPRGGIRDDVVAVPTGQGHTVGYFASKAGQGLAGVARGVNIAAALPAAVNEASAQAWLTEKARLTKVGRHRRLPMLQFSDNQRRRELAEAIEIETLAKGGGLALLPWKEKGEGEHGHGERDVTLPYDPRHDAKNVSPYNDVASPYRWGMSVDLDRCTGCSACIAACYLENNVPVVGEAETRNVRQMAWIRIDRYVTEGTHELHPGRIRVQPNHEKLGEINVRNLPMLCQQCGGAPCESVCPVLATNHNEEGLNAMVYNRCIGTRFCANNCPYKVRRFNFWDYQLTRWPEPMPLGLNPDVTVRGQGVMEKCTFCIQRIQYQRQIAKRAGRNIEDGEVQTACQQTCPTNAIIFGNLRDSKSRAWETSNDPQRGYAALQELNTRPAITYLAKVERGKVEG